MEILVDDVLVYRGVLRRAPASSNNEDNSFYKSETFDKSAVANFDFAQTILFTNDKQALMAEQHRVYTAEELAEDTSVLFFDEGRAVGSHTTDNKMLVRPTTTAHSRR